MPDKIKEYDLTVISRKVLWLRTYRCLSRQIMSCRSLLYPGEEMRVRMDYNAANYTTDTILQLMTHLQASLSRTITAGESCISRMDILSDKQGPAVGGI